MNPKITDTNGFRALKALEKAAALDAVDEIEGNGMEPGRVFIHLRAPYRFWQEGRTRSVGCAADVASAIEDIEVE